MVEKKLNTLDIIQKNTIQRLLRHLWYPFFNKSLYFYLSKITVPFVPKSYRKKIEAEFYSPKTQNAGILANIVRADINAKYYALSEEQQRKINREKFWGSAAGKKWHDAEKELLLNEVNLTYRKIMLSYLLELCSNYPEFNTICEVGTGNGLFLKHLSQEMQMIDSFIGVDINKEQIAENKKIFNNENLQFIYSDIVDYLNKVKSDNIIIVALGTFEFFTEKEILELLDTLKNKFKYVALALCEPFNLESDNERTSKPCGDLAYGHNYTYLLEQNGYRIFRKNIPDYYPTLRCPDWVIICATNF